MANSLNLHSAYLKNFTNLSMLACIIENQKQKFANNLFREVDNSEPGR
mgnify:CR=1